MSPLGALALAGAGVLAGLLGTAGGITSSISYPALLVAGLSARGANIANNVALVAYLPGSAAASGPELAGRGRWLLRRGPIVLAGSGVGAGLLLLTPSATFARIVPALIALGSATLLAEPRLRAWRERRERPARSIAFPLVLFAIAVYNGYFGGGAGVMVLTLVLVFVEPHLARANALKNVLIGIAQLMCALVFALAGSVSWADAGPLALGMLVGGNLGPRVARRLPPGLLRTAMALFGFGLAVWLWLDPHA